MHVPVSRRSGQRARRERLLAAALDCAGRGWVVCTGAHPRGDGGGACSCDRLGCPAPAAHPISPAWQLQGSSSGDRLRSLWAVTPDANVILPTGHVFDVLEVPARAGTEALARLGRAGAPVGPVAAYGANRYLFFVATRGAPEDEDEWWSSHLDVMKSHTGAVHRVDSEPEVNPDAPDLRWHCRDSYVVAPPSVLPSGQEVSWVLRPDTATLPDPVPLLDILADACAEHQRPRRS